MVRLISPPSGRRARIERAKLLIAALVGAAAACTVRSATSFVQRPACAAPPRTAVRYPQALKTRMAAQKTAEECKIEEENPMTQIKSLGTAGAISYALWELAFWVIGGGGAVLAYLAAKGHLPDFSTQEEIAEVTGEAFLFINGARFLVPLRIGLAVSTTPFIRDNVVNKLFPPDPECVGVEEVGNKGSEPSVR